MLWFGHQWNEERGDMGGVWGLFSSQSQNVSYLWLHVEEEATGSID